MSKRHHQNKPHLINRVGSSISVDEEGFVLVYEDIQRRAYQIHEEKGGSDLENWLEAERVLKEERHAQQR
jgi:hypothetical protein